MLTPESDYDLAVKILTSACAGRGTAVFFVRNQLANEFQIYPHSIDEKFEQMQKLGLIRIEERMPTGYKAAIMNAGEIFLSRAKKEPKAALGFGM